MPNAIQFGRNRRPRPQSRAHGSAINEHLEISNLPIRQATVALDAARAAELHAKRTVIHLEQTRSNAEWADAEAAEKARAEDKPEPDRTATIAHDQEQEAAAHEHKIAQLTTARAEATLQDVQREHGATYVQEAKDRLQSAESAFHASLRKLQTDYSEFASAVSHGKDLGLQHMGVGVINLDLLTEAESTNGGKVELPRGAVRDVIVHVGTLLGKFSDLGKPEPKPEAHEPIEPIRVRQIDEGPEHEREREADEHRKIRAATERALGRDGVAELIEAGEIE